MGYRLNRVDEPVFMAVSKPLLTDFGIYHRLESFDKPTQARDTVSIRSEKSPKKDVTKPHAFQATLALPCQTGRVYPRPEIQQEV